MKIEVEYDGSYPNLCSGTLRVTVEGVLWIFPQHCMDPGGSVIFDEEWTEHVTHGPWSISEWPVGFPVELKIPVVDEINEVVPWGNCGGCV